ncbi:MAG: ubiquinol-cytochrome c reductase iron-sulfur subunit [Acidobacteriota bacterium]
MSDQTNGEPCALTRRAFFLRAGEAASLTALGSMLQACGGSPTSPSSAAPALPTINGTSANGVVSVTIDPASALATVGGAALVQASNAAFLVARTAQSSFTALTAICTHEGCTITGFQSPKYVCPCHGSQYSTSGGVLSGPATQALRQFTTQFANNVLTIAT